MQLVNVKNIPGLQLLIHFERAFDLLSWSFMQKVLSFFNFNSLIIQGISAIYKITK